MDRMHTWLVAVAMLLLLACWQFGIFDNVFSEYRRSPSYYPAIINSEEDYKTYCDNAEKIMSEAKWGGGVRCGNFVELVYYPKKTNILYFWE